MVPDLALGFAAGLVVASVTAPVGVSGAVFMLPVQLSVLGVPNPAVTPTNLLYNVVAGPGALLRHLRAGSLDGPLTRRLLSGTVPGVLVGVLVRVFLLPGPRAFRVLAGLVLVSLGLWLATRTLRRTGPAARAPSSRTVTWLALATGVVGGVYGIGGGSILSPVLVGWGMTVAVVAPAALASTFVTSVVGAIGFAVLALVAPGSVAPDWPVGVACGLGGLVGGYLGARLHAHVPERALRVLLGCVATTVGALYLLRSVG